ncbi:MAG: cell surface protein SprA [Sphingobacteriia bacterium]
MPQVSQASQASATPSALLLMPRQTSPNDTDELEDRYGDPTHRRSYDNSRLPPPPNLSKRVELAPDGQGYYIYEQIGTHDIRPPTYVTRAEYERLREQEATQHYFAKTAGNSTDPGAAGGDLIPELKVNSKLFATIFGSNKIDIKPNISVLLDFSVRVNRMRNPSLTIRQQRNTSFNFDQQIQMDVVGSIGEKLKLRVSYDTEATFSFENQFKISYEGDEDDIIKSIEAGNVSMPVNGTLISGGQNLWGIKMVSQWGPIWVTTLASQQRGKTEEVTVRGGSQETEFEVECADYDMNRHFFLSHHFRNLYEQSLVILPLVNSHININRVELWMTNKNNRSNTNTRNCIGLVDLGENAPLPSVTDARTGARSPRGGRLLEQDPAIVATNPTFVVPDNNANNLYEKVVNAGGSRDRTTVKEALRGLSLDEEVDFELYQNMRLLTESEYTLNRQLGYVSLNSQLQDDEALYVSFEYTIAGSQRVFRVGEFSIDQTENQGTPSVLFVKTLKPGRQAVVTADRRQFPTWDLMMKNFYSIGGFNIQEDKFNIEVVYQSTDGSGDINYLPTSTVANTPLVQVFDMDRLTNNKELGADNRFDYIPGISIQPDKGTVVLTRLEPFGQHLVNQFTANRQEDSIRYAFTALYRQTQQDAIQFSPQVNRFKLRGRYSAKSSSEIYLNTVQLTPGSVKVLAGGRQLQEGIDYTVDYQIGKVSIINPGLLTSGQDISVKFESNTLFGIDQKTMLGARVEYRVNKDIQFGTTLIHLNERPLINKVIIGDEPISNTVYGFDVNVRKESRFITGIVDKLPFFDTKAPSEIQFTGEFAQLLPGMPRQIRTNNERGIAYIDDFEGARTTIDLMSQNLWKLSSRPTNRIATDGTPLGSGDFRAKLAWYAIDPVFFDQPQNFGYNNNSQSLNNQYSRRVNPREVFPNRDFFAGNNILTTFDLHYWPSLRGQYNLEDNGGRLNPDGTFTDPERNWGGIMRRTASNTDFEAANFEFIEFWVMDPYLDSPTHEGGDLYLNLGLVSEDVLDDGQLVAENGLPATQDLKNQRVGFSETAWGRVPSQPPATSAFSNDPDARGLQDVGLDGINDEEERALFAPQLAALQGVLSAEAFAAINADPSGDNYVFFRNTGAYPNGTFLLERYRSFNHVQGNSPLNSNSQEVSEMATPNPDVEDLNVDGKVSGEERFYEYRISLRRSEMVVGQNYVVDRRVVDVETPDNVPKQATWYQFRIPLRTGSPINGITDFKSMNFLRMYLTGFRQEVVLRFGKMDLVSTQWRTYRESLKPGGPQQNPEPEDVLANFSIGTVNIEENGTRNPFNYVIPPDIDRVLSPGAQQTGLLQNEQSMVLKVQDLEEGDARGVFKTLQLDLRNYERLKMWVHAEPNLGACANSAFANCGDAEVFVRLGTDLDENYYEFRQPLCPSTPGDNSAQNIWSNELNIELGNLNQAKFLRNQDVNNGNGSLAGLYTYALDAERSVVVRGTPQLNNVKNVMIGIRNPDDGGQPICVEMWANELRVTDFVNRTGWAANARANIKLADLGSISVAGQRMTAGFGGVEERINDRSLESTTQYDLAMTLNAGKLLPQEARLEIPTYVTLSERFTTPLYNPSDPDIRLEDALNVLEGQERELYRDSRLDYEKKWGYAFNNVRRAPRPGNSKIKPWSFSNLSFTYGFNEVYRHNTQVRRGISRTWNGAINYTYNLNPKNYRPLQGVGKRPNLINEFNFYLLPKSVTVRIEGMRRYDETVYRQLSLNTQPLAPVYNQNFTITRTYQVRWDLTRSLSVNYTATNQSRVDMPRGRIDTPAERDTVRRNLLSLGRQNETGKDMLINMGRTVNFNQQINITYRLPFDKVTYTDWITASVNYNTQFTWLTAALQNNNLGNSISNQRTIQTQGQLNMTKLYSKFPFVERWTAPIKKRTVVSKEDSSRTEEDDPYVAVKAVGKTLARWLFSIQTIDASYTVNQGTSLAGYAPRTNNFGMDWGFRDSLTGVSSNAPGAGFLLGAQPNLEPGGFINDAGARGWFSRDTSLVNPYNQTDSRQFTARTSVELFKGFRVDLNVDRATSWNANGLYQYNNRLRDYDYSNRQLNGTFSMSFLSFFSAFERRGDVSAAFNRFDNNRRIISKRLADENSNYAQATNAGRVASNEVLFANNYYNGYLGNSQEVLVPAFLSAYGPYNPNRVRLDPFPRIPLPNWNVAFNGLMEIPFFKKNFRSVTLRHGYRSTYSTAYLLNLNYFDFNGNGLPDSNQVYGEGFAFGNPSAVVPVYNFQTEYTINSIVIQEAFTPLVGFNFAWKNGITTTLDYKRSRNLVLNIGAQQLAETRNSEFSLNLSYRKDGLLPSLRLFGRDMQLKNTITFRLELTLRNITQANRKLDSEEPPLPTGGNLNFVIKPGIDYMINTQLTVRAYVEHNRNTPAVSTSFPTTYTAIGVQLQFNLTSL